MPAGRHPDAGLRIRLCGKTWEKVPSIVDEARAAAIDIWIPWDDDELADVPDCPSVDMVSLPASFER